MNLAIRQSLPFPALFAEKAPLHLINSRRLRLTGTIFVGRWYPVLWNKPCNIKEDNIINFSSIFKFIVHCNLQFWKALHLAEYNEHNSSIVYEKYATIKYYRY